MFGQVYLSIYLLLNILFIYSWETQRERQRQAEGEAGSLRGARCGILSLDLEIMTWAKGRCSTTERPRCPCLFIFKKMLFIWEREREQAREHKQGQRERRKLTPCWTGTWSPTQGTVSGPWDHELAQRQMLNWLSHPGTLGQVYTLCFAHHKYIFCLSPYNAITIPLTMFFMPCLLFLWLIHSITGSLCLPLPFTHFAGVVPSLAMSYSSSSEEPQSATAFPEIMEVSISSHQWLKDIKHF